MIGVDLTQEDGDIKPELSVRLGIAIDLDIEEH
jgi:hypothetical protein